MSSIVLIVFLMAVYGSVLMGCVGFRVTPIFDAMIPQGLGLMVFYKRDPFGASFAFLPHQTISPQLLPSVVLPLLLKVWGWR